MVSYNKGDDLSSLFVSILFVIHAYLKEIISKIGLAPSAPKFLWWSNIWPNRKVVKQIIIFASKNLSRAPEISPVFLIEKWLSLHPRAKLPTLPEPSAMYPLNHFRLSPGKFM